MIDAAELEQGLAQHIGTDTHWAHFSGLRYTTGIKDLAEKAEAFWLIDLVASYQVHAKVRNRTFQLWRLTVDLDTSTATIEAGDDINEDGELVTFGDDGNGGAEITPGPFARQLLAYTDFPLATIELYVENGVLLLPSEH